MMNLPRHGFANGLFQVGIMFIFFQKIIYMVRCFIGSHLFNSETYETH
jgi:hypothetical protein